MDTVSEVLDNLRRVGKDNEFVVSEAGSVIVLGKTYGYHDIRIIQTFRFEGESDPADGAIIFLIQTHDGTVGYSLDAYGVYTNHSNDGFGDLILKLVVRE